MKFIVSKGLNDEKVTEHKFNIVLKKVNGLLKD